MCLPFPDTRGVISLLYKGEIRGVHRLGVSSWWGRGSMQSFVQAMYCVSIALSHITRLQRPGLQRPCRGLNIDWSSIHLTV